MRKSFVFVVLVPAVVLVIVLYLFLDGWVESGLEYAGEKATGAKVEIDHLRLTLSPIGMSFDRLQVADPKDPWSNLVETGRVSFAMDVGQLLRAKFIVETIEANNVLLGTKRTTDGSLPAPPPPPPAQPGEAASPSLVEQAAPALVEDAKKAPVFDLGKLRADLKLDSLVDPKNLQTYRLLDSLQRDINRASAQWDTTLAALDKSEQRAKEVEAKVKAINVNEIKTIDQAKAAVTSATEAYNGIRDLTAAFNERKRTVTQSVGGLAASIGSIDDVVKQDVRNTVALAKLPDVDMKGLASLVLGKDILNRANTYLGYVDLVREKVPQYTPKPDPEQPKRSEGINVQFPAERAYPKFWIKQIVLSGGTDANRDPNYFAATGNVLDISNDQRITGKPIVVALTAAQGRGTTARFDAFFDRRTQVPHDNYKLEMAGIPVGAMELGRSGFLPSRITNAVAKARVEVDVPGSRFESNTRLDLSGLKLEFGREPKNLVERIARDVLASVSAFFVNLRMWKEERRAFDVAFSTDLDDQLSSRAKKVIGEEVARIQNEIRAKVNERIAAKRREVEGLYQKKRTEVEARVKQYEDQLRSKLAVVEQKKKELEQRVEQEKKKAEDAVKKKAGDLLKGIIKK